MTPCSGDGDDQLFGISGRNILDGGTGDDVTGNGNGRSSAGPMADKLHGGDGDDAIVGGDGINSLDGGGGGDRAIGRQPDRCPDRRIGDRQSAWRGGRYDPERPAQVWRAALGAHAGKPPLAKRH